MYTCSHLHCCRSKDYSSAQALYEKCLKERPRDLLTLSNLSAVHIQLASFAQAAVYANNGLNIDPSHVKCLFRSGVANMHLEQYELAITNLKKANMLVGAIPADNLALSLSCIASCQHEHMHSII